MNEKKTPRRIIKKGYQPKKQPVKTNPSKVKPKLFPYSQITYLTV